MRVLSIFSALSILAASAVSNAQGGFERITWSGAYGAADLPLSSLACSQWAAENNYTTLGDVPGFPLVGGASIVNSTNTSLCGVCFLILADEEPFSTVAVIVDAAGEDFVLSLDAMNALTNGQAEELGSVEAFVASGHVNCST